MPSTRCCPSASPRREQASPGDSFEYTFVAGCSDLTLGCVNAVLEDTIPADLTLSPPDDIVQLPANTSYTWDPSTRLFRVVFTSTLGDGTSKGMPAGSPLNLAIRVHLPADSQIADGATIRNTGDLTADNSLAAAGDGRGAARSRAGAPRRRSAATRRALSVGGCTPRIP